MLLELLKHLKDTMLGCVPLRFYLANRTRYHFEFVFEKVACIVAVVVTVGQESLSIKVNTHL